MLRVWCTAEAAAAEEPPAESAPPAEGKKEPRFV